MKKYLLDTNICIHFLGDKYNIKGKIEKAGLENCLVSEVTIAELKFGAENSQNKEKNRKTIDDFTKKFSIIPIYNSLGAIQIVALLLLKIYFVPMELGWMDSFLFYQYFASTRL